MTEAEKLAQAEAENRAKAEAAARADAETPAWAKTLADKVSECMGRMDSLEKSLIKNDAESEEEKKAREDKAKADAEEAERADKARKDYAEEAAKADAARADAVKRAEAAEAALVAARADSAKDLAELKETVTKLVGGTHVSADDKAELAKIQARADGVAQEFGSHVSGPMFAETPLAYRRRLAAHFQPHSPTYKDRDLAAVADSILDIAEEQIYADAVKAARVQPDVPAGTLRAIVRKDRTGREITEFQGEMGAWMDQFKAPVQRQISIYNGSK